MLQETLELQDLLDKKSAKQRFRRFIFDTFGIECAYCDSIENLTLDHVKPRCKGGETTTFNLIPACRRCNENKGSSDWRDWYRRQASYAERAEEKINDWLNCGKQRR